MTQKAELGKLGEDLACRYLVDRRYKIIERNFRKPWGELDIIAKSPEKILVFVEVKTVQQSGNAAIAEFGNCRIIEPEMQMTAAKIKKLKRVATLYAGHYSELIDNRQGWRIDLLALTINGKDCVIKHYENI
jgi:putative endonuclease